MAEKYGTVPKKFTREWWEYFWMYYKWHTIAAFFILLLIAITIYQNITAPKYDLTLTYAGEQMFSDEFCLKVEETLSPLCKDVDGNGKGSLMFTNLNLSLDSSDPEYTLAMSTKLQLSLSEDEVYIYILDRDIAQVYAGEDADNCVFAPLDDWLKTDLDDDTALFSAHGKNYGISAAQCSIFDELNTDMSDKYLFIRYYPRKDQQKKQLKGYMAAIELANTMIQ